MRGDSLCRPSPGYLIHEVAIWRAQRKRIDIIRQHDTDIAIVGCHATVERWVQVARQRNIGAGIEP
mgnify:CR=1 FL=1